MEERTLYSILLIAWVAVGAAVFIALFFIAAPYGRHARKGWGYTFDGTTAWVLMEAASPVAFAVCYALGNNINITAVIFLVLWEAHYVHRAFIYPFSLHGSARRMPLSVVTMGFFFNMMNGYLNGRYLFTFSDGYAAAWLGDPRFIFGTALFIAGFIINRYADSVLRDLRKPGESGYKVSNDGIYKLVSSPNYLGEITIWVGWAIATWSLPGLVFAFWTVANLLPRARANHLWYKENFPDYPPERKALIPRLW